MSKTLLIVSGGAEAIPGILKAKEMGLHVVVSDYNPDAPGFLYADDRIIASTYDVEETVGAAKEFHEKVRPIDGVICVASDVPLTVASVAEKLGLPGLNVETARLASDKLAMKDKFCATGIPVPWYKAVFSAEELRSLCMEKGFSLIIKPVDSRGARGVLLIKSDTDLKEAFNTALENSPTGRVMVEEFISGPQISTEAVIVDGTGYNLGFADRNYEEMEKYAPHIIENGGTQPSILPAPIQKDIANLAIRAGKALGVTNGIVKGDMVFGPRGPMVIEVATRLSGGYFSSDQIPLHTGVDILKAAIKLALGQRVNPHELERTRDQAVAIRYFFPPEGLIKKLPDISAVKQMPGVNKVVLAVAEEEVIEKQTNHTKRAGCVITVAVKREDAVRYARDVVAKVEQEFIIS
ncbi:MAG: ATP-grasp domain-containing protein [Syntrophomonadaceae bacterium]|nr:ATP-grasp domain-containing protein [Syntrophomonadaceae bacterium]